ncbi:MAG: DUF433 domain-containing protein [Candidatus Binatia bacterium]
MARIEISKHLVADTRVCAGRLVFRGTRIAVGDALELLAAGYSIGTVSKQYRGMIPPEAVAEALIHRTEVRRDE